MKQVIIIRKDLNMRKGKMIAQGAHASMVAILSVVDQGHGHSHAVLRNDERIQQWLAGRFTKIVVSVDSEEELLDIFQKAESANMIRGIIRDDGKTEFHGVPTTTAAAIGPDTNENIDPITGHLKLL